MSAFFSFPRKKKNKEISNIQLHSIDLAMVICLEGPITKKMLHAEAEQWTNGGGKAGDSGS